MSINQRDGCYDYDPHLTVTHTVAAPETTLDLSYCDGIWGIEYTAWVSGVACGIEGERSECLVNCCQVPVLLEQLEATPSGSSIVVKWQASGEHDVAGFQLLRHDDAGGAFICITSALIPAGGRRYSHEDRDVVGGRAYWYRLVEVRSDGSEVVLGETTATAGVVAGEVLLHAGHPNPFNPTTALDVELPAAGQVVLDVFDSSGRWIQRLAGGRYGPGRHRIVWDGWDHRGVPAPSGTYFARLRAGGAVRGGRLVLVR